MSLSTSTTRSTVICLALSFASGLLSPAHAEEPQPNALRYQSPPSDSELADARKLRTSGIALTIAGLITAAAGTATGAASFSAGQPIDCRGRSCGVSTDLFYASIPLAIASSLMLSVGPALWANGGGRLQKLRRIGVAVAPSPQGASAGLSVRF